MDSVVGLMVISKRVYAKGDLPKQLLPVTQSLGEPLATHSSTGDPPALAGGFGSDSCGVYASLLSFGAHTVLSVPSTTDVYIPQSCDQILLASRSHSLGTPGPSVGSPGWEA